VLGRKIIVGVAPERLRGGNEFRIGLALPEGRAARRRSHGVHVGIVGKTRVGMVIEGGDLVDFREETLVGCGQVRPGIGTGLG
jgi:hypothetical protein